jgi:hypothetical protein
MNRIIYDFYTPDKQNQTEKTKYFFHTHQLKIENQEIDSQRRKSNSRRSSESSTKLLTYSTCIITLFQSLSLRMNNYVSLIRTTRLLILRRSRYDILLLFSYLGTGTVFLLSSIHGCVDREFRKIAIQKKFRKSKISTLI